MLKLLHQLLSLDSKSFTCFISLIHWTMLAFCQCENLVMLCKCYWFVCQFGDNYIRRNFRYSHTLTQSTLSNHGIMVLINWFRKGLLTNNLNLVLYKNVIMKLFKLPALITHLRNSKLSDGNKCWNLKFIRSFTKAYEKLNLCCQSHFNFFFSILRLFISQLIKTEVNLMKCLHNYIIISRRKKIQKNKIQTNLFTILILFWVDFKLAISQLYLKFYLFLLPVSIAWGVRYKLNPVGVYSV